MYRSRSLLAVRSSRGGLVQNSRVSGEPVIYMDRNHLKDRRLDFEAGMLPPSHEDVTPPQTRVRVHAYHVPTIDQSQRGIVNVDEGFGSS